MSGMRSLAIGLVLIFITSCGAGGSPVSQAAATPTPTPTASPTAAATVATCRSGGFGVAEGSKATVRIREVLFFIPAPFDAIMSSKAMRGQFLLNADGRFDPCSSIVVDVRELRSDDTDLHPDIIDRDRAIADLLDSRRHSEAILVPERAVGLPSPLPAQGEWTFTLESTLTIRSLAKPRTWQVTAKRDGATITATATTEFGFAEYAIERPRQVLSLDDKIRLEVKLVATQR